MISKKFFSRSTLLLLITLLSACAVIAPPNTPTPTATSTPTPTSTPTATPTATPTPKPTTMPTGEPQDETWMKLKSDGYKIRDSSSIIGANGYTYFVYVLNHLLNSPPAPHFEDCWIAFYQWDGYKYKNIKNIAHSYITECQGINWNTWKSEKQTPEERVALNSKEYWSDINGNGIPEFGVLSYDACNNCSDSLYLHTAFYEIYNDNSVINIVENLPHKVIPGNVIYYKDKPLTIWAYDAVIYNRPYRHVLNIYWLYQWSGTNFINVSSHYPDEFRAQAQKVVSDLQKYYYGKPIQISSRPTDILAIYNGAELPREEGLKLFLEVTDPSHWPGTKKIDLCWLQASRAYAQIDFEQNKPFRIFLIYPRFSDGQYSLPTDIDSRFDTSACK